MHMDCGAGRAKVLKVSTQIAAAYPTQVDAACGSGNRNFVSSSNGHEGDQRDEKGGSRRGVDNALEYYCPQGAQHHDAQVFATGETRGRRCKHQEEGGYADAQGRACADGNEDGDSIDRKRNEREAPATHPDQAGPRGGADGREDDALWQVQGREVRGDLQEGQGVLRVGGDDGHRERQEVTPEPRKVCRVDRHSGGKERQDEGGLDTTVGATGEDYEGDEISNRVVTGSFQHRFRRGIRGDRDSGVFESLAPADYGKGQGDDGREEDLRGLLRFGGRP